MKMGKPHGQGKYWFADGGIYEGTWKDGLRHGHGKQWYKDGRIYEGNWVSDKREE
jgi:antitoxin component YwqK of YwqJK toxin-antitoxin module